MNRYALLPVLVIAMAACGAPVRESGEAVAATKPTNGAAEAARRQPAVAPARSGKPVSFREGADGDSWFFSYSWPAQANAIAQLDALLKARKDKVRAEVRADWQAAKTDCPPDSGACTNRSYEEDWQVVADLPDWLSLSSAIGTYSGGAHGNHGFDALLWDKRAGKARAATDLFASKRAFNDAVRAEFCAALNKERSERRDGEELELFEDCFDPTDAVIILGSSNGRAFDRIGFLIAPYLAGPYVEGDYEVTLPVTAKVLAEVKPQFRSSFKVAN